MRALWTGAISFGLVNIPVKIYSATQDSNLDLDMLDKNDHAHIKYKRVNENTGKEVSNENIVKGFDYEGSLVVLESEDFKKASAEKTDLIEIIEFVNAVEVNTMFYETPYYVEPQKSGSKAYALLRSALEETKMAGLCTFIMRNKENLALIKTEGNALVMNKIRFQEEIRESEELNLPVGKDLVKPAELKMAVELVKQLSAKFDLSKYKDNYSVNLLKLIKDKAQGKKPETPKLRVTHSTKKDLIQQLQESLNIKKAS